MNLLAERFAALLSVKTIVTFAITFVFVVLALRGDIGSDMVNSVVIMVIGFYFGTQYEQDRKKSTDEKAAGRTGKVEATDVIGAETEENYE